jgi:hypothetical protein
MLLVRRNVLIIITSDVLCLFLLFVSLGKIFLDPECYKRSMYVCIYCDQFHLIAYLSSFIFSFSMKNYSPKMIAQLIKDIYFGLVHHSSASLVFGVRYYSSDPGCTLLTKLERPMAGVDHLKIDKQKFVNWVHI